MASIQGRCTSHPLSFPRQKAHTRLSPPNTGGVAGRVGPGWAVCGPLPHSMVRMSGKDSIMGVSTPKTPFNLAEFLSQKAPPGSRRKPAWNRPRSAAPTEDDATESDPVTTRDPE